MEFFCVKVPLFLCFIKRELTQTSFYSKYSQLFTIFFFQGVHRSLQIIGCLCFLCSLKALRDWEGYPTDRYKSNHCFYNLQVTLASSVCQS